MYHSREYGERLKRLGKKSRSLEEYEKESYSLAYKKHRAKMFNVYYLKLVVTAG